MARYQAGQKVAFTKKLQRCGIIVTIDSNRGYKIDTGKDIIYAYENEIVLISSHAPIRPQSVMTKIDKAGKSLPAYTPAIHDQFLEFLNGDSDAAKAFGNYILTVSDELIRAFINAVANSRFPDKIIIGQFNFG